MILSSQSILVRFVLLNVVFCVVFLNRIACPFLSAIALSALLIFTASDDSFGIFKLYLADGGHLE